MFRPLLAALACAATATVLTPAAVAAGGGSAAPASPTLGELVGQRLVVAFSGTTPGRALRRRIRHGQVGGVILFGPNVQSASQLHALAHALQRAAHRGGQPRLIVATDQEGGLVKRLPWAPPNLSAEELGQRPASRSLRSGTATGKALRAAGVNVDLAPVADVPRSSQDFIAAQHRAFSTNRFVVANDAAAFATGLEAGGAWPTLKHFPGLGLATVSTDDALVHINASGRRLRRGVLPYRVAIRRGIDPLVMLSTAVYPALSSRAAAWSHKIIHRLLRRQLGFRGVTVTDSLDSAAAVRGTTDGRLAVRSAAAGADLILITGSASASKSVYHRLLAAAQAGTLSASRLRASYDRIVALKQAL